MGSIVRDLIEISGIDENLPEKCELFKHLNVEGKLILPEGKPDMEQMIKVMAEVIITEKRIKNIPVGTTLEGQNLTGRILIVEGEIREKIKYAACEPTKVVHGVQFHVPISIFLMLPSDYKIDDPIDVKGYIEDIEISILDKRKIYQNVVLLMDGKN